MARTNRYQPLVICEVLLTDLSNRAAAAYRSSTLIDFKDRAKAGKGRAWSDPSSMSVNRARAPIAKIISNTPQVWSDP